jgi:hypothetical protein
LAARALFLFRNPAVLARPPISHLPGFGRPSGPLRGAAVARATRLVFRRLRFEEIPVPLPDILPGRWRSFLAAANYGGSEGEHRKQRQRSDKPRVFHYSSALDGLSTAVR